MILSATCTVTLTRIYVECIIGCHPEERMKARDIYIDLRLTIPLPAQDALHCTIDYDAVAIIAAACAVDGRFHLIESLAGKIAENLMQRYGLLQKVEVKITKPHAAQHTDSAGCEICVQRGDYIPHDIT